MTTQSPAVSGQTSLQGPLPTWVLLILSGLLLGLAYPPNPVGWLCAAVGPAPLLVAVERSRGFWQTVRWSYVAFLLFSALSTWWVGSWQARADQFLMISCVLLVIVHPLFFVVPVALYRLVRRWLPLVPALLFFALLWCGGEYLHSLGDLSYPWLTLGNTTTYDLPLMQMADLTGVWGLSLVLLLIAVTVSWIWLGWSDGAQRRRRLVRGGSALALLLLVPHTYGLVRLVTSQPWNAEKMKVVAMRVAIVQPNVNPWDKWKTTDTTDQIRLNVDLSRGALAVKPDMFLWVENAIPYLLTAPNYQARAEQMRRAVDELGVPVLTGFPDYIEYPSGAAPASARRKVDMVNGRLDTVRYDHFNSAGMFLPGRGLVAAYHKMQLVPFGERLPYADEFPFLMDMLSWDVGISTWGKGQGVRVLPMELRGQVPVNIGAVVCFESVYPRNVRQFVEHGANVLVVITNDGWYLGTPGPLQHERFAMLRAIETRRPVVRAANTGISCAINMNGEILAETEENEATVLNVAVVPSSQETLYLAWGEWVPVASLIGAGVLLLFGLVRRGGEHRGAVRST